MSPQEQAFQRALRPRTGRTLLLLSSLCLAIFSALVAFQAPHLFWLLIAALIAYLALILWGVMNLRLQMFSPAVCQVSTQQPVLALTFDDGPDPISTPLVLAALSQAGVVATFFVIGSKVKRHPELLAEMVAQGHELGIHSHAHELHYSLLTPRKVKEDIESTAAAIEAASGQRPLYFRPPVGQMSPRTAAGVAQTPSLVTGWNVRAGDGVRRATASTVLARVLPSLQPGAIVLLHDAWQAGPPVKDLQTAPMGVQCLPQILEQCAKRGLKSVTLSELFALAQTE